MVSTRGKNNNNNKKKPTPVNLSKSFENETTFNSPVNSPCIKLSKSPIRSPSTSSKSKQCLLCGNGTLMRGNKNTYEICNDCNNARKTNDTLKVKFLQFMNLSWKPHFAQSDTHYELEYKNEKEVSTGQAVDFYFSISELNSDEPHLNVAIEFDKNSHEGNNHGTKQCDESKNGLICSHSRIMLQLYV